MLKEEAIMPIEEERYSQVQAGNNKWGYHGTKPLWDQLDKRTQKRLARLQVTEAKILIGFWSRFMKHCATPQLPGAYTRLENLYRSTGRDTTELRQKYLMLHTEGLAIVRLATLKRVKAKGPEEYYKRVHYRQSKGLSWLEERLSGVGIDPLHVEGSLSKLRAYLVKTAPARYSGPRRKAWWSYRIHQGYRRILLPQGAVPVPEAGDEFHSTRAEAKAAWETYWEQYLASR